MAETVLGKNSRNMYLVRTERLGVGEIWALPLPRPEMRAEGPLEGTLPYLEFKEEDFHGGVRLTPDEVIRKGSIRLTGFLQEEDFPDLSIPTGDPEELPVLFLKFLVQWGFPGGIVGGPETFPKIASFLEDFLRENPNFKVMVTGPKRSLLTLKDFLKNEKILLLSPYELELWKSDLSFSFILILDAEQVVNYATSFFFSLLNISRRLSLAHFRSKGFLRTSKKEALSKIFGVSYYSVVWDFCILDRDYSPLFQPRSFSFSLGKPSSLIFAEFSLKDGPTFEVSIPPRSQGIQPPSGASFIEEGERLSSKVGEKAEFVPFRKYYPTYSDLNPFQLNWYLYWRTLVRKGEFLDTDLSYIFLYVYELINSIGIDDPLEGYGRLFDLWRNYRKDFPRLDNYLIDWIADFSIVYSLPVNPLEVYKEALSFGMVKNPDLLLDCYLRESPEDIPLLLFEEFSFYKFLKSPFFQKATQPEVQILFQRVFFRIDDYIRESTGSGIFEKFRPPSKIKIRRIPFQGALWGKGSLEMISLGEAYPYSRFSLLVNFLSSLFKEIENGLREKFRFPGRLGDSGLSPTLKKLIKETLSEEISKPFKPFKVDGEVIKKLLKESEEVRDLIQKFSSFNDFESPGASREEIVPFPFITQEATFPEIPPDWNLFVEKLKPFHKQLLLALTNEENPVPQIIKISRENGIMPEALLDSLNEVSLETVGDLLLDCNSTPPVIFEENKDIIIKILDLLMDDERP